MEIKEETTKKNFFKKLWYSITKFEQYPIMAAEGIKRAIIYLIILTAILSVFIMIDSILEMKTMVNDLAIYVKDNFPEFSYVDGKLSMETENPLVIENFEQTGIDKIVVNTLTETAEQKEQVEKDNEINGISIFFYNDEIILKTKSEDGEVLRQPFTYSDFITNYTGKNIEKFNKTEFVEYLTSKNMLTFYSQYAGAILIYLIIINIMIGLLNALEIAILGVITATMLRMKMRFSVIYNMAIHSLTLPIVLNILYVVINYFTDFTITYFQIAYVTIAYIYLAAAIFILRDDVIKKLQEVEKIKQEQVKVREELKEEEDKEQEEKKKEDKKEENKDDEPQGSEA